MNQAIEIDPIASAGTTPRATKSQRVDDAYSVYVRETEAGREIDPNDFCTQFPTIQSSLARLVLAHEFLKDRPDLVAEKRRADWPVKGETFVGFHLQEELGQGTFARVFLANEIELGNRLVVVKIARRGGAAEAKILGSIQHANVVPIHSIQADADSAFTVACMPYLGSATLHDVFDLLKVQTPRKADACIFLDATDAQAVPVKSAPATPRLLKRGAYLDGIRYVGLKIAQALAHIHEQGVCHLDLKPSNVLIRPDGEPVLLDFNLSSDSRRDHHVVGGTIPYMSPEQLHNVLGVGDKDQVGTRSDIYSFGVLLYELATGAHPFGPIPLKATTEELATLMRERQPRGFTPVRQLNPDVENDLARLIEKCLRNDPNARPQSAAEIASILEKQLRPAPQWRRRLARHPVLVAACLLLGVLSAGAAAVVNGMTPPATARYFAAGREHYRRGEYAEAVEQFNLAIKADEKNHLALFGRGRALHKLGDDPNYSLAAQDFQRAYKLDANGKYLAAAGFSFQSMKATQIATARVLYERAEEAKFVNSAMLNNMGLCVEKKGDYQEVVLKYFDLAIASEPPCQATFHNRASQQTLIARNTAENIVWMAKNKNFKNVPKEQKLGKAFDAAMHSAGGDFEKALKGPLNGELLYHAACYYSMASVSDPALKKKAIGLLRTAILEHGFLLTQSDRMLRELHDEKDYQNLALLPRPAMPVTRGKHFVDPINDEDW